MRMLPPLPLGPAPARLPHRGAALALLALALGGCSYLPSADAVLGAVTPYRIEIVQGNVVTREQMARIRPGLTRLQVRDTLGSPLVTDIFHDNRWDYVFTIRRQGTEPQRVSIVLRFEGDSLQTIEAPELPSEQEFVASISPIKPFSSKRQLALTDDQRRALPPPRPPEPATAEAFRPEREYPPLEAAQIRIAPPPPPPAVSEPLPPPAPATPASGAGNG